jgi:hypothetical protein
VRVFACLKQCSLDNMVIPLEKLKSYCFHRAVLPAIAKKEPVVDTMVQIKQVIAQYHEALHRREHGGVAQGHAINAIEALFMMPYSQTPPDVVGSILMNITSDETDEVLEIKQIIINYHNALRRREHGGVAADKALHSIESLLGISYA